MRVIAGSAGSVPLYEVRARTTRSMTDRVKTSLFSILDPLIRDAEVLDLFAGTGALGIESLSRGAAFCTFVEKDRACLRTIARNLERTKLADRARIVGRDALRAVGDLGEEGVRADLVFLDPPFCFGQLPLRKRLVALATDIVGSLLKPAGLVVYHHEFDTAGDLAVGGLVVSDQRRYGRNVVTMLRKRDVREDRPP